MSAAFLLNSNGLLRNLAAGGVPPVELNCFQSLINAIWFYIIVDSFRFTNSCSIGSGNAKFSIVYLFDCLLTIICGVVGGRAVKWIWGQERDQLIAGALVDAPSVGQHVHLVKHVEQSRWRLVNRADYCPPLVRQHFEQVDSLVYWHYI